MAQIELAPEVFDDFDRMVDHLECFEVENARQRVDDIVQALQVLTQSPSIGRPATGGKRELVIGQGSRGYVALYRLVADINTAYVLAIRSQRERGYKRAT